MEFVNIENFDEDFWKQNPQIQYISPFAEFKKKKDSSKLMKAFFLLCDVKSKFKSSGMTEDEIKKDIAKNFLNNVDFKWDDYSEIISAYKTKCQTKLEQELEKVRIDLEGLVGYMQMLRWEIPEEAVAKHEVLKDIEKFTERYKNMQELVKEEIKEKKYRGGYRLSFGEKLALN